METVTRPIYPISVSSWLYGPLSAACGAVMDHLFPADIVPSITRGMQRILSGDNRVERCGLITLDGTVVELPNRHPDAANRFRVDTKELHQAIIDLDEPLMCFWHTHPVPFHPEPSEVDYEGMPEGFWGCVLHIKSGLLSAYDSRKWKGAAVVKSG